MRCRGRRVGQVLTYMAVIAGLAVMVGCGSSTPTTSGTAEESSAQSGGSASSGEPLKVAFVYVNPAQDDGWDQAWEDARKEAEAQLGDKIQTSIKESVPPGPQLEQVFRGLAQDGTDVIYSTTSAYIKYAVDAAKANPDVFFVQQGLQGSDLPNLKTFDLATEDGFYVLGSALAATSEKANLGSVASFPMPQILRQLNALVIGARKIKPDATLRTVMTNSWFDPNKDRQAATALASSGVGGIANNLADTSIPETAASKGVPWVGINTAAAGPETHVMSTLYSFKPIVLPVIQATLDGNFNPEFEYLGVKEGAVELSPLGKIYDERASAADKAKVDAAIEAMENGEDVFVGPIKDAAGKEVVSAGQSLSDDKLASMNFVVEGVKGVKLGG